MFFFVESSGDSITEVLHSNNLELSDKEFQLGYENLSFQQISSLVLPNNQTVSGFSQIGHIAHFNLRDETLPFKTILAQVILDKLPTVKTVVNKTQNIETEFRNFSFEILAGDDNTVADVVEHGVKFRLDFAKVYWNSRLSREHQRIVNFLDHNSVLIDPFCGVGPFALPAAKKSCKVYANDLNPESIKWLKENIKLNKISPEKIEVHNLDASNFFQNVLVKLLSWKPNPNEESFETNFHVPMNLPSLAHEFLEPLKSSVLKAEQKIMMPIFVHLYCFVTKENPTEEAILLVHKSLAMQNVSLGQFRDKCNVHEVRNVSVNKVMMCVSFNLKPVLNIELDGELKTESDCKRVKLEN